MNWLADYRCGIRPIRKQVVAPENLTSMELREMFRERVGDRTFEDWMRAFCDRKYNSDFSREMSRSVRKMLESL